MSKPKPKTKRSRGSAITDAARPAVPAIEAVEPVKVESPAVAAHGNVVSTGWKNTAVPLSNFVAFGTTGTTGTTTHSTFEVRDSMSPPKNPPSEPRIPQLGDKWPGKRAFPWSHPAVIVAICTTITAIIGAWNHHTSSMQYDATLRQTTANERNIGHVWHEMNVYGDYFKPDWSKDAGEIPAVK